MPEVHPFKRATAVALLLAASACSSGTDERSSEASSAPSGTRTETSSSTTTPPGITFAEWQQQTTTVCEEFEPQQDAVVAAHPQSGNPADVIALIDALTPVADRYLVALGAIPVPEERANEVERTYELYQLNFEAAATLRAAAVRGDQAAMQQGASALSTQATELMALLADLGVPACV